MSREAKILFLTVYALVTFGIVMTYSASAIYADYSYDNSQFYLIRQAAFVVIGTIGLLIAFQIRPSFWQDYARAIILLAIAFLILVYVPVIGHAAGGAQRWIRLGFFNFQPAEFAKIAVLIYLADYLSRKMKKIQKGGFLVFIPPLILIGTLCVLTLAQPDLGSCAFIFIMTSLLFFLSGIRLLYVGIVVLAVIPALYFLIVMEPYRLSRVTTYLNPWDDPQGSGFQLIQSFLAFGLGGIQGVGLGQSTQKLFYLPSSHNDFIFAVIAEELGLIGLVCILLLYGVIFVCGIRIASKFRNFFQKLLTLAIVFAIILQALINMLVSTGLVPTKGLPLPFISYGGTSIVMSLFAVGILLGLDRFRNIPERASR